MKRIIIATLLLISANAFAQTTTEKEAPYIDIVGTAEKEVVPDEIFINITLLERYEGKEKITIEKQETDMKNALKNIGIDISKSLSLNDANADYVKVKWYKKEEVVTQKEFTLKVADATTAGKVFEQLDSLKITSAYIAKTNYTKLDSLKKEVRIEATKDAKSKAEWMLTAIGEQLGKPEFVVESSALATSGVQIRGSRALSEGTYYVNGLKRFDTEDKKSDEIQFQKIKVELSVRIRFLIK